MRPNIDYLIVTLAISDNAATVLLVHLFDLFVSVLKLRLFPFWNDHILDSNGDTGAGSFVESEFLELVQRRDRYRWTCTLITTPNDLAKLFLACWLIEETKFLRPDLIENDATGSRFNHARIRIPKTGLPSAIRVFKQNPVMVFDRVFDHCKFYFESLPK